MTKRQKAKFIKAMSIAPVILIACKYAGVTRRQVFAAAGEDSEFQEAWFEAVDEAIDRIELEALERALNGNNRLLLAFLQSNRPEKYNPITVEKLFDRLGKQCKKAGFDLT